MRKSTVLKLGSLLSGLWMMAALTMLLSAKASAQTSEDSARLYAAYTYNLMSFTQWPKAQTSGKLTLCVAGQNRDSQLLNQLNGKQLQGHSIEVVNFHADMPLLLCNVLFVASAEYADLFDRAVHLPILLLTNIMPDNGRASMITLSTESGRVVFDVNLALVKRVGLQLPPSLLKLARRVLT